MNAANLFIYLFYLLIFVHITAHNSMASDNTWTGPTRLASAYSGHIANCF